MSAAMDHGQATCLPMTQRRVSRSAIASMVATRRWWLLPACLCAGQATHIQPHRWRWPLILPAGSRPSSMHDHQGQERVPRAFLHLGRAALQNSTAATATSPATTTTATATCATKTPGSSTTRACWAVRGEGTAACTADEHHREGEHAAGRAWAGRPAQLGDR